MKPTPPRRSMVLRSSCQGDCTSATGTGKHHHHHHHHHHQHTNIEHNTPVKAPSTQLKSKGGSSQKRTVTKKETISKTVESDEQVESYKSKLNTLKQYSPEKLNSVVEKVLDYSLATLSPIVVASQELAESWRKENGVKSRKHMAEDFARTVISQTTTKYSSSLTNLKRSRLTSNHLENSEKHFTSSPIANSDDWAKQNGTTSALTQHSKKTRFNDYSSADESEDIGKTDYTYAHSASYCINTNHAMNISPPNMSRPSIHSSRSGSSYSSSSYRAAFVSPEIHHVYSSTPKVYQSKTVNSIGAWNSVNATQNVNWAQKTALPYGGSVYSGLDYDSDDDEIVTRRVASTSSRSFFSVLLSVGECILPVQTVWKKFWGFVYWILTSLLLWDAWILNRRYFRKRLLLPLLLLLLLPLCLLWRNQEEESTQLYPFLLTKLSSLQIIPVFTSFVENFKINQGSVVQDSVVEVNHVQVNSEKIDEVITKMHSIQQMQLSRPDIEDIVRSVVKEEVVHLAKQMNGQEESILQQAKSLSELDVQLMSLESQMKLMLAEELKSAKEKILSEHRSDHQHSLVRLQNLEKEMDSLKDNIQHIKETQNLLLDMNRNCCRNHTYDPALVESQVAAVLLQIMGHPPKSGKTRSEYQNFAAWLKSSFVNYDELSLTTRKVNEDLETLSNRTVMVAKSVAAAAVSAALLQHQQSGNLEVGIKTQLTEMEVRQIVRSALVLYDADKIGMADFALESAGGSILSTRCSETFYSRTALLSLFGVPLWYHSNSPRTVIQPGVHPGECWAFKGSEGYLVIELSNMIQPTAFSLEHVPRPLAPNNNIDSAPREFSVFGLRDDKDLEGVLIGRYAYDADGEPLQHFLVKDPDIGAFQVVELQIHNNHGNLEYTCLYRFRVHGRPLNR